MRYLLLALTLLIAGRAAATGEINVLTDLKSPFPPGCVAVSLPEGPGENGEYLVNVNDIFVPSVDAGSSAARVRVQVWRMGCHDDGYSVVMVRLQKLNGGRVLVPRVFADAGEAEEFDVPDHVAQLIRHPAVGNVGASGNEINEQGITYMLGVDRFPITPGSKSRFTLDTYNGVFTLEMYWGDYAGTAVSDYRLFTIPEYVPQFDPPQNEYQVLHGRMSGQYVFEGLPNNGLFLQIGEKFDDTNTITATFFTYMNGEPFWVVGAKDKLEPGFDIVTLDMLEVEGGEFFSVPPGSYTGDDVSWESIGTLTIEALDCNHLLIGYNFSEAGLGSGSLDANRLVRTAGYDCNPWD